MTFDGPDLEEVATMVGYSPGAVVEALLGADLSVALVGFAPGFPYLVGLPPELASIPRRASPRTAVPAGSVAVGGGFASVYPSSTPGGWRLLGRTSVPLFDPDRPPYARLSPGDTVRFTRAPVAAGTRPTRPSPTRRPLTADRNRFAEVVDPGLLSLVEDGGRSGSAGIGVPPAGPADPDSMRLANRLVGNPDRAAAIEVTAVGPRLRFAGDAHVGVVGSAADGVEVRLDDRPVATGAVVPVSDRQVLTVGRVLCGLRAYVAVAGGFDTPLVVGSRSTDMLTGLGPGPLATGDRLAIGTPSRPHGQVLVPVGATAGVTSELRVVAGPHHRPTADAARLGAAPWTVGDQSNRIGVRLTRSPLPFAPHDAGLPSVGMVTGAVQLPTDGNPIILGPDHATVGGYPVIACVIAADLHIVGQLRPGDAVRFITVDRTTAQTARLHRERVLDASVTGWFPTAAGT